MKCKIWMSESRQRDKIRHSSQCDTLHHVSPSLKLMDDWEACYKVIVPLFSLYSIANSCSCCRILLNQLNPPIRRVLSGGKHFTLLPRNRGHSTSGDSAPKRSSNYKPSLKIIGEIIFGALVVYYVCQ